MPLVRLLFGLRSLPARLARRSKAAMNVLLVEQDGGTRIETETRVLATDAKSRDGFARYWRLIRPGSGAIRRAWLRAIARRAEAQPR